MLSTRLLTGKSQRWANVRSPRLRSRSGRVGLCARRQEACPDNDMANDVCFGYEIRSDLAFEYLREGGATGVLEVVETRRDDTGESGEPAPRVASPTRASLHGAVVP